MTTEVTLTQALENAVGSTVAALQRGHLDRNPAAAAALARLRRAAPSAPGSTPDVWAWTIQPLADSPRATALLGRTDTPSAFEHAAHVAVTLYAVHQQGRPTEMHRRQAGSVGRAVAAMQRADQRAGGDGAAIARRFSALATASGWSETVHHLRSLITQLRGEGIALDYGRLAVDLARLPDPGRSKQVRLAWGRDLYRRPDTGAPPADPPSPDPEPSTTEE